LGIERTRLHKRIGEGLEKLYVESAPQSRSEGHAQDLAYHFVESGELEKGLKYSIQAARQAGRLHAFDEALHQYAHAVECAETLNQPERLAGVIKDLQREDSRFHMEGGSWTNNISWVRGYESLLSAMEQASSLFYEKVTRAGISSREHRYRNALFHLLCSQTSCYRYWGEGCHPTSLHLGQGNFSPESQTMHNSMRQKYEEDC
jgi:hypothetical protein